MRLTDEWYGIIKDYATDNHKNLLTALNEIFQSDDKMTEEQFDELEAIFKKEERAMLYRVHFNTYGASYSNCFTDKEEAEKFYNSIKNSCCYTNVTFQIG